METGSTSGGRSFGPSPTGPEAIAQLLEHARAGKLKPTAAQPPQSFRNRLVERRVHLERDRLIASLTDDDACEAVCRLAASRHNGDLPHFFQPPTRGSYNMCYFVRFGTGVEGEGDKWVVRVPLDPCLAFGGKSKLESEIATMK